MIFLFDGDIMRLRGRSKLALITFFVLLQRGMVRIKMKNLLLGHTNSYHGFSLEEALGGIAAAGFKYVEINAVKGWTEHLRADMSEKELGRVRNMLDGLGLEVIALSGHCNLMDGQRLDDFRLNIELAAKLGCKYIISSVGEAHFGEEEERNDGKLIESLKSLLPLLEKHNITLAIETHGDDYGTGQSLVGVVLGVNSPLVGINFDTANCFFWGGVQPMDDIKTCVQDVKFVHLKDKIGPQKEWNFPGAGNGELPLRELIKFMTENGYQGPYSVEIEYTEKFCMREKDRPGDIDIANGEMADSFKFLSSIFA